LHPLALRVCLSSLLAVVVIVLLVIIAAAVLALAIKTISR
jgi:hypothetical protein